MQILALGPDWLNPQKLAESFGLVGVLAIIFAECGLLIGLFLPGDSLLFATGLLVAGGIIAQPLWLVIALLAIMAFAGNITGYFIGRTAGPAVFKRPESRLFKPEYVEKTEQFFERYGGWALILARFMPILRTFIPVMAGTSRMRFARFAFFSGVGGVLWAGSMTTLGYFLGQIEWVQKNLEIITITVVVLSIVPIWFELRRRSSKGNLADEAA